MKSQKSRFQTFRFTLALGLAAPCSFAGCANDVASEEDPAPFEESESTYEAHIDDAPVFDEAFDTLRRPTKVDQIRPDETLRGQFSMRAQFLAYSVAASAGDRLQFQLYSPFIEGIWGATIPREGYRLALYRADRSGNPEGRALAVGTSTNRGINVELSHRARATQRLVLVAYRTSAGSSRGLFDLKFSFYRDDLVCGGSLGASCADDAFCAYDHMCGASGSTGLCRPMPASCPNLRQPVCGCDGETYASECVANTAGVSVAHGGRCEPEAGRACGSRGLAACNSEEYCHYTEEAACGASDRAGTCTPIPSSCPQLYAPVCGCDGKSYSNGCLANAAGTSVSASGECQQL